MATNENDWFGNILNNFFLLVIIYFLATFGYSFFLFFLFPLIGQPEFFENLLTGFGLTPEDVDMVETMIN